MHPLWRGVKDSNVRVLESDRAAHWPSVEQDWPANATYQVASTNKKVVSISIPAENLTTAHDVDAGDVLFSIISYPAKLAFACEVVNAWASELPKRLHSSRRRSLSWPCHVDQPLHAAVAGGSTDTNLIRDSVYIFSEAGPSAAAAPTVAPQQVLWSQHGQQPCRVVYLQRPFVQAPTTQPLLISAKLFSLIRCSNVCSVLAFLASRVACSADFSHALLSSSRAACCVQLAPSQA